MNLLLLRAGYPPIAVRPEDRTAYIASLEHAHITNDLIPFRMLLMGRLHDTLIDYLGVVRDSLPE